MNNLVLFTKDHDVAIITIDNAPVNALSPAVLEQCSAALDLLEEDVNLRAAVVTGAGRTFVAGADIKEFVNITSGQKPEGDRLNPLLDRIEKCPKPIVMAIHGQAFGGGLELAMAGHYRVASPDAQTGQPEVRLGLIPGA